MSYTMTIKLSDGLYHQLQRAVELFQQPVETIITHSLAHTLPPLLEDIPYDYQADISPLLRMTDGELQQELRQVFPPDRWTDYETLLEKKKKLALMPDEDRRLTALRREADVMMLRRSYAAVLLKRRGYRPPTIQELALRQ